MDPVALPNWMMNAAMDKGKASMKLAHSIFIAALSAVITSTGCSNVAVYQRSKLAHFSMQPSDAASVGQDHVYAVHEGATGGAVGTASGCGCN